MTANDLVELLTVVTFAVKVVTYVRKIAPLVIVVIIFIAVFRFRGRT